MKKHRRIKGALRLPILSGIFMLFSLAALLWGHDALAGGVKSRDKKGSTAITITSDSMKADRTSKTVVFKGDVEAREDFLLCSDELKMNYTDKNEVQKIDARGHVRIYRASGVARAKRAEYDRGEHVLVLTGDAVIERCADTVRGEMITLYLDDDSALVEGAKKGRVKAVIVPGKKCADDGAVKSKGSGDGAVKGVIDVDGTHCKSAR